MRTPLILVLVLVLFAGACGSDDPSDARATASDTEATAAPDGSTPDDGDTDGEGGETRSQSEGSARSEGGSGEGEAEVTPRPTVPPSAVAPPHAEWYHFAVTGTRKTPSMATEEPYPDDARFVWDFTTFHTLGSGVEFVYSGTLDADKLKTEDRILLRKFGLRRTHQSRTLPGSATTCTFEPPIAYVNTPLREETYEPQEWAGTGCSGRSEFTNHGRTTVKDAKGKTWEVWRITERTSYTLQTAKGELRATHWFNNDAGIDIKSSWVDEGTDTGRPYRYERTFLLEAKKDPEPQD